MKIGIISDLHYKHWQRRKDLFAPIVESIKASVKAEKPDLIIDAGDLEMYEAEKFAFETHIGCSIATVKGNHDYYHYDFDGGDYRTLQMLGKRFILATLWTDFDKGNPEAMSVVEDCLVDYRFIGNFNPTICYDAHKKHVEFIQEESARATPDVIVTHHCPSMRSVDHKYLVGKNHTQQLLNYGFSSDLDELVKHMHAKVWVHGHTHVCFDYHIGETRVICNPLGYPGENKKHLPYKPVYVEI